MTHFKKLISFPLEVLSDSILAIIYMFALLYIVCWFHEGGHYISAYLLGYSDITLIFDEYHCPHRVGAAINPHVLLYNVRNLIFTFSGMVAGNLPIIYAYKHFDNYKIWTVIMFVVCLFMGCKSDVGYIAEMI